MPMESNGHESAFTPADDALVYLGCGSGCEADSDTSAVASLKTN